MVGCFLPITVHR